MTITSKELKLADQGIKEKRIAFARKNILAFARYTMPTFESTEFHKKYYKILNHFVHGDIKKLIISCPPQHGKLISHDTPILTTKGWTTHGNLVVGDYIFGRNGKKVKVLELHKEHFADHLVTFTDGSKILCHGQHEWAVHDRSPRKEKTLETQFMKSEGVWIGPENKRGGRARFSVDPNVAVDFSEKELPIHPYILGAWLGDGYSSKNAICHASNEMDVCNKFISLGYEVTGQTQHKDTGVYSTYFRKLYSLLKDNNLFNNKHIPDEYLISSREQRLELLAGLIDTDGYVYHKNGRVTYSGCNKILIDGIKKLVVSLGCRVTISKFPPVVSSSGIVGRNDVYQLTFNPDFDLPVAIERKKIINKKPTIRRRGIKSISKHEPKKGRCITVEGGLYLVGENLILTHNSQGSSINVPAMMAGLDPDRKIATVCYSATKARKFGRKTKQLLSEESYQEVFETRIPTRSDSGFINTGEEIEMVGHDGSLKMVGYQGGLTGDPVDVLLMDDLYKDWKEANSPTIRDNVIDWYITVADTRLHNDSQQLIVFTRWHEEDLVGFIEKNETVININSFEDIENAPEDCWFKINFQAIKDGESTEIDPRENDEPLWPERHSLKKLKSSRRKDPVKFDSLYQGNPTSSEGLLYSEFKTYKNLPNNVINRKSYTDTADQGEDYLCSIVYDETSDGKAFIVDILYTQEGMEVTEPMTADLFKRNNVRESKIESNNGGRGFARKVDDLTPSSCVIKWFHQSDNKESRIISNSATVNELIYMPEGWHIRWPEFFTHVTKFKKKFKANSHDDCVDTLTGVAENFIPKAEPRALWL